MPTRAKMTHNCGKDKKTVPGPALCPFLNLPRDHWPLQRTTGKSHIGELAPMALCDIHVAGCGEHLPAWGLRDDRIPGTDQASGPLIPTLAFRNSVAGWRIKSNG